MRSLAIYFALFVVSAVVVIGVFPTPVRAEADGGDQVQIEDRSPRIRRLSMFSIYVGGIPKGFVTFD